MMNESGSPEFFEGAEKLLEIWFKFPPTSRGLKLIPRKSWEAILKQVNCAILSSTHSATMDAYLLSESSMFVTRKRLILKTCGNTTLLLALNSLFECVTKNTGNCKVSELFYSRKDFLEPCLQQYPHRSFDDEVEYLKTFFPGSDSHTYSLGPRNNQWHLFALTEVDVSKDPDSTFEILMNNISSQARERFLYANYPSDKLMTEAGGFHKLFPQGRLDAKAFEPWGYSLNVFLQGDKYSNLHITPQEECSYASFETNSSSVPYSSLVTQLLSTFQPQSFVVTFFTTEERDSLNLALVPHQYEVAEVNTRQLRGYFLKVLHFNLRCPDIVPNSS